ncbi:hypothetical protein AL00_03835 [Sphingobium indicum F2]|uniref:Uncharacterized protein n=1 Tax=Sphingobium indicum F2 TaxID=1450518 RepID=A0A8E0WVN0_9SPHN|nr:hypothetical protein AL00_03835 [Sphingobium indicum F2]
MHDLGGIRERETIEEGVDNARTAAKPSNKIGVPDPAIWRDQFGSLFQNVMSACAVRRRQIGSAEDVTASRTTRQQHPAMMRAAGYFRHIPPGPAPRPAGDRPAALFDIRSQAVRADTGKIAAMTDVADAAYQFAGEHASIVGVGDRVVDQCFERDATQPRDIGLAVPTLQIMDDVTRVTVGQWHLPYKFRAASAPMAQGKTIEHCPARFERRSPHA